MPLSAFSPVVSSWFLNKYGEASPPQKEGWPAIRRGKHTLIAAPTGTGKTLTAFLWAIDSLLRQGDGLPDATQVLYVSPLKALGNDIQKNLQAPLAELRAMDPSLPDVRVMVRSGDTPASQRTAMLKRPPHILVTTPESLYILLTSDGGRRMLGTVRTVIVDEIHAVAGDKRGSHLSLSLERLSSLAGDGIQRIGLSATQKPLSAVGNLLVGKERECTLVDVGHRRELDLALEVPDSPLETVCSHETWEEVYKRIARLIEEHRTTIVFVNTRKLAERVAARLTDVVGKEQVTSHHGSLSRDRRLDAEQRLKEGKLRALVATASLELGIDVGEVDLVIQVGVPSSIAVMLQRIGRAGHALAKIPKGRIFPLTPDELACAAAILDAVRRGELDRTPQPGKPLDILAQQIVAACVPESWSEDELFQRFTTAWPYRNLSREDFDAVVKLHTEGRLSLLHRDGVNRKLRATKRARITALTSGGAIPDNADYRVVEQPGETPVGSVHEDFAVEANAGDIFQLGNASWQILKVEPGLVRVADARGAPPTLPFWIAEAPARTRELSAAISEIRKQGDDEAWLVNELGLPQGAASQLADYVKSGRETLGRVPTQECVVLERFFDEAGGMQLVLHSPFGGRINRAWGLALRKKFCRGFGFELQAAANEEAIVLSLGPQHSFELNEVFGYLNPKTARETLVQAVLPSPLFATRWRWNVTRSLVLSRTRNGNRVPAPLLRMRADDELARAFPQVMACGETLPPGDIPIPWEHPIVRQTLEDALHEAMDLDGLIEILHGLREGKIETVAVDTPEPSAFARGILNAMPYAFLDDAPLEERRTQAVLSRRGLDTRTADTLGALDEAAVARVREEAWPQPENAEEVHEALLWIGYVTGAEARQSGWDGWLGELHAGRRVVMEGGRWFAVEATRDPVAVLRGRMEALGPVFVEESASDNPDRHAPHLPDRSDRIAAPDGTGADAAASGRDPASGFGAIPVLPVEAEPRLRALEAEGALLQCRLRGRQAWCHRRLLARIHRYTIERLRKEIEPVTAQVFWRTLACWQHADPEHRLDGPRGVAEVIRKLAGFEIPAAAWESSVLPLRVKEYRPDWLDQLSLTGEVVWGRFWGAGASSARATPVSLVAREELPIWKALAGAANGRTGTPLSTHARVLLEALAGQGALFTQELQAAAGPLPEHLEMGLAELIGHGLITCDSFGGLRRLIKPEKSYARRRKGAPLTPAGRWSLLRSREEVEALLSITDEASADDGPAGGDTLPDTPPGTRPEIREGAERQAARSVSTTPNSRPVDMNGNELSPEEAAAFAAEKLLNRYGIIFKRILARERIPVPWRDVVRECRRQELRGEIRGGRFVSGFAGEQFALPEAVDLARKIRKREEQPQVRVGAADPLNLQGILTPEERIPSLARRRVEVG